VICSEINPIRKMNIDIVNSKALMLVKRPDVMNVYK